MVADEGTGQGVDYRAQKRFSETLPSLGARYQFDSANQVFVNVAKNFKAPGNFSWQGAVVNGCGMSVSCTESASVLNDVTTVHANGTNISTE